MIDHLDLREEDRLADIGGGTGIYSLDILEQVDLEHPIFGVDPYPEMLAAIPDGANIEPIATTALEEMKTRYGHLDTLRFVDHFDYITAIKNRPS